MDELLIGDDGLYAICCLNLAAKTEEEVIADFSRFGEVVKVRQTGSATGLVFIRFRLEDEARKVLNDHSISANGEYTKPRMAKSRSNGQSNGNQDSGRKYKENNAGNGNQDSGRKYENNAGNGNQDSGRKYRENNAGNGNQDSGGKYKENNAGNGNQFSNKQNVNEGGSRPDRSYHRVDKQGGNFKNNDSAGGFQNRNWQKNGSQEQDGDHAVNTVHKRFSKGFRENVSQQYRGPKQDVSDQFDEPPPLVRSDGPVNGDNDIDGPPALITSGPPPLITSGPPPLVTGLHTKPVPENVIIANIPLGTSRKDIYHLCSHLEPTHMSSFDITGIRYSLQYCHLYFSDLDSAETAEKELHGMRFRGKQLIVKRYDKLFDN